MRADISKLKRGGAAQRHLLVSGIAVGAGAGALLLLFLNNPARTSFFPICFFHAITRLDCPGCGSLRGIHALLHGRVIEAIDFNLLLIPTLAALAGSLYAWLTGRETRLWNFFNRPILVLWIVCCFWVLRNIPVSPFAWLGSAR